MLQQNEASDWDMNIKQTENGFDFQIQIPSLAPIGRYTAEFYEILDNGAGHGLTTTALVFYKFRFHTMIFLKMISLA